MGQGCAFLQPGRPELERSAYLPWRFLLKGVDDPEREVHPYVGPERAIRTGGRQPFACNSACRTSGRRAGGQTRAASAAYTSTAAAALALSESTRPRTGSETSASHVRATRGRRPDPPAPTA